MYTESILVKRNLSKPYLKWFNLVRHYEFIYDVLPTTFHVLYLAPLRLRLAVDKPAAAHFSAASRSHHTLPIRLGYYSYKTLN